jgi:hypothetical protein
MRNNCISKANFLEANTMEVSLNHLKIECTIPVFARIMNARLAIMNLLKVLKKLVEDVLDYKAF